MQESWRTVEEHRSKRRIATLRYVDGERPCIASESVSKPALNGAIEIWRSAGRSTVERLVPTRRWRTTLFYQHSASPPTGRDRPRRGCGRAGLPERPPEIWSGNQSARGYTYLAGSAAAIVIWRDAITGLTGIRRRTVAVARLEIAAALAAMPASAAILAVTRSGKPRRGGAEFHGNKSARPPTSPVRGARGMGDTLARSR